MDNLVKSLAQFIVWLLISIGSLCMILSPVARFATGEELYLWIALGASFAALILALAINRLIRSVD